MDEIQSCEFEPMVEFVQMHKKNIVKMYPQFGLFALNVKEKNKQVEVNQ